MTWLRRPLARRQEASAAQARREWLRRGLERGRGESGRTLGEIHAAAAAAMDADDKQQVGPVIACGQMFGWYGERP